MRATSVILATAPAGIDAGTFNTRHSRRGIAGVTRNARRLSRGVSRIQTTPSAPLRVRAARTSNGTKFRVRCVEAPLDASVSLEGVSAERRRHETPDTRSVPSSRGTHANRTSRVSSGRRVMSSLGMETCSLWCSLFSANVERVSRPFFSNAHRSETSVNASGISSGFRNREETYTVSPAAHTPNCSPPFFLVFPAFRGASSHVAPRTSLACARCAGTTPSDSSARHRSSGKRRVRVDFGAVFSKASEKTPPSPSSNDTTTSPASISGKDAPAARVSSFDAFFETSSSVSVSSNREASRNRNSRTYVACAAAETPSAHARSFSKCAAAAGEFPHFAICLPSAKCRCSRARAHGVLTRVPSGKKPGPFFEPSFDGSGPSAYETYTESAEA